MEKKAAAATATTCCKCCERAFFLALTLETVQTFINQMIAFDAAQQTQPESLEIQ